MGEESGWRDTRGAHVYTAPGRRRQSTPDQAAREVPLLLECHCASTLRQVQLPSQHLSVHHLRTNGRFRQSIGASSRQWYSPVRRSKHVVASVELHAVQPAGSARVREGQPRRGRTAVRFGLLEQESSEPLARRVPLPPSHQTQQLVLQLLALLVQSELRCRLST